MTGQLELDYSLPATQFFVEQRAVVFTDAAGCLAYTPCRVGTDWSQYIEALEHFAQSQGRTANAQVMVRTITAGEWRPEC